MSDRYRLYAMAVGASSPEAALATDRKRYPGGHLAGFIVWIQARWQEWRRETGYEGAAVDAAHDAFDEWLAIVVTPQTEMFKEAA